MGEVLIRDVETLLSRFQSGDNDAFSELTLRFSPMLRGAVGRFFRGIDAEEAYLDATDAFRKAALSYRADRGTTFGLYAKICVIRAVYELKESKNKRDGLIADSVADAAVDTEAGIIRRDSYKRLLLSVRLLTSGFEFDVLSLYLSGYSEKEIAARLSKTEKQIANAKARIFRKLRENASVFSDIYF